MDFEITDYPQTGGMTAIELGEGDNDLVNLQMVLVTSSMNHEYTRKALSKTRSYGKREDLLARMSHLKRLYFTARQRLAQLQPERLEALENELRLQKQTVLSEDSLN